MGNVSVVIKRRVSRGSQKAVIVDITGAASYATNGDTIVAADIAKMLPESTGGLADVDVMDAEISSAGHSVFLDRANKKLKFFNGTTEIANATNLSAVTVRVALSYGGVSAPVG